MCNVICHFDGSSTLLPDSIFPIKVTGSNCHAVDRLASFLSSVRLTGYVEYFLEEFLMEHPEICFYYRDSTDQEWIPFKGTENRKELGFIIFRLVRATLWNMDVISNCKKEGRDKVYLKSNSIRKSDLTWFSLIPDSKEYPALPFPFPADPFHFNDLLFCQKETDCG